MRDALAQLLYVRMTPSLVQPGQLLLRPGELHREQRALDLERGRALQTARQADIPQGRNEPLRGVELPPAYAVAIVVREDVVEVVVTLAVRDERQEGVVARRVLVRIRARTPHVRQRVDEERDVLADDEAQDPSQDEGAPHVADQPAGGERQAEVGAQYERQVEAMLELQQRIALQIGNVAEVLPAAGVVAQHPADVREPEAALDRVRVAVHVIDVQVMGPVTAAPRQRAVLQRHGAEDHEEQPQAPVGFIGPMGPEPVVTAGDRHPIGNQEERVADPGTDGKSPCQAVPRHQHQRRRQGQGKEQGGGPQPRGVLLFGHGWFGDCAIRHAMPVRVGGARNVARLHPFCGPDVAVCSAAGGIARSTYIYRELRGSVWSYPGRPS